MLKNQLVLNGRLSSNDYRVATISRLYLTVIGNIMQNLEWCKYVKKNNLENEIFWKTSTFVIKFFLYAKLKICIVKFVSVEAAVWTCTL